MSTSLSFTTIRASEGTSSASGISFTLANNGVRFARMTAGVRDGVEAHWGWVVDIVVICGYRVMILNCKGEVIVSS